MKENEKKYTIEELFEFKSGNYIKVVDFFKKYDKNNDEDHDELIKLRTKLESAIQKKSEPLYGCWCCRGFAALRAVKSDKRNIYFKAVHYHNCKVKTKSQLSKEQIKRIKYNGQQESPLHLTLKHKIADLLSLESENVNNILIDKPRKLSTDDSSKEWKRPDIFAHYNQNGLTLKIAFELQLSTTFLDVIVSRQDFYRRDKSFILWIFHEFSVEREKQRLMQLDIVVSNNMNAFVLNKEAIEKSDSEKKLVLHCFYKFYKREDLIITSSMKEEFVRLSDLTFNNEYKVFYFDSEKQYLELSKEIQKEKELIENAKPKVIELDFKETQSITEPLIPEVQTKKTFRKNSIKKIIEDLREAYKNAKSEEDIPFWVNKSINLLNETEIQLLNNELGFNTNNKSFIRSLLKKSEKTVFLKFLLKNENIFFELNEYKQDESTPMIDCLMYHRSYRLCEVLFLLSQNNYFFTQVDKEFLNTKYPPDNFDSIENYFANLMACLNNKNFIERIYKSSKLKRFISAILSIKNDNIISWNYNNLRAVGNQILPNYPEYASLFVVALKHYNKIDELINEDKKKKRNFIKALNEFKEKNISTVEDEPILRVAFPELF